MATVTTQSIFPSKNVSLQPKDELEKCCGNMLSYNEDILNQEGVFLFKSFVNWSGGNGNLPSGGVSLGRVWYQQGYPV